MERSQVDTQTAPTTTQVPKPVEIELATSTNELELKRESCNNEDVKTGLKNNINEETIGLDERHTKETVNSFTNCRWHSRITSRSFSPDIDNPRTYTIIGCIVTACSFLLLALSCGTIHAWGVQQEYLLSHEFKNSDATVLNWVGTLQYVGMYLLGIPAGWLAETWSYPLTCFLGAIFLALGQLLGSFCKEASSKPKKAKWLLYHEKE